MLKIGVTIKIRNFCMNNSVEALILFRETSGSIETACAFGVGGSSMRGKGAVGCVLLHCFREVHCQ